jgi:hypothetical protein
MCSKDASFILLDLLLVEDVVAGAVAMELKGIDHEADEGLALSREGLEDGCEDEDGE